jgi:hypothetical protein
MDPGLSLIDVGPDETFSVFFELLRDLRGA